VKTSAITLASIAVAAALVTMPAAAANLDCGPLPAANAKADAELSQAIRSSKLDDTTRGALTAVVRRLSGEGVSRALIVDHAVAAYCPLVAKDDSLSFDRKREAVRRFAAELTGIVYDPAVQTDTAIILSLPVKPDLSEKIDLAATKAGQSRDAWVLQAIQAKLAGG